MADMIMKAKSGTGKTLVFCTVILERFDRNVRSPQSIVVTPTREIAVQVEQVLNSIGANVKNFKVVSVIGGRDIAIDRVNLNRCTAVVATPGRAIHLIENKILNTENIRLLVLDEADKLMAGDFRSQMKTVFKALPMERQFISVSATYADNLDKVIAALMKDPVAVSATQEIPNLIGVQQFLYATESIQLDTATSSTDIIQSMKRKVVAIEAILGNTSFQQCILFSNSQLRAESFQNYMAEKMWASELIVGSHSQDIRSAIMKRFREYKTRILITSDLLARGIDIELVNLVINIDVPRDASTYLHRIGRCGRFGRRGIAITLIDDASDQLKFDQLFFNNNENRAKLPDIAKMKKLDLWNYKVEAYERCFGDDEPDIDVNVSPKDEKCDNSTESADQPVPAPNDNADSSDEDKDDDNDDADSIERNNFVLLEMAELMLDPRGEKSNINVNANLFADYERAKWSSNTSKQNDSEPSTSERVETSHTHPGGDVESVDSSIIHLDASSNSTDFSSVPSIEYGPHLVHIVDIMKEGTVNSPTKTNDTIFVEMLKSANEKRRELESQNLLMPTFARATDLLQKTQKEKNPTKMQNLTSINFVASNIPTIESNADSTWSEMYWRQYHDIVDHVFGNRSQ